MHNATLPNSFVRRLHWIVVAIVAFEFIVAWTMPEVRKNTIPGALLNVHMTFGAILLPFVLAFFSARFYRSTSEGEYVVQDTAWARKVSSMMYVALYTLLILVPLTGWSFASTRGWTVTLFGTVDLPQLFAHSTVLGIRVDHMHSVLATVLGILILGHVAAALYHHFVLKDELLRSMLPRFLKLKTKE